MVRKTVELNPHQKRAAKERTKQKTKFDYCPNCQRLRWMTMRITTGYVLSAPAR
jgi:hypothetical protein